MTHQEALKYLYSFLNYEVKTQYSYQTDLNLSRMAFLMKIAGNPHRKLRFVMVAGTKGKGSTAYLLASILLKAGHSVGLYTSPHLQEVRERISFGGKMLSKKEFGIAIGKFKKLLGKNPPPHDMGPITFFELLTSAAITYFFEQKTDLVILEVGLGGRLDATNIVKPLLCILTPISYDHQDKLGNTLEKIAREKAAVVKERNVVVSSVQPREARKVFEKWCRKKRAPLFLLGKDFEANLKTVTAKGSSFDLFSKEQNFKDLKVKLSGRFQVENAACAVQAALMLRDRFDFRVPEKAIRQGLLADQWPGRFEILRREPCILLDGAHNGASMRVLLESVRKIFPDKKVTLLLALSSDKDFVRILKEIKVFSPARLMITEAKTPRAFPCEKLAAEAKKLLFKAEVAYSLKEALQELLPSLKKGSVLLITGSFFLVGEAHSLFKNTPVRSEAV